MDEMLQLKCINQQVKRSNAPEYYSAIKTWVICTTWVNLKGIILNEKAFSKVTYCMLACIQHSQNNTITKMEERFIGCQ